FCFRQRALAIDVPLLGLAVMDLARFLREAIADILGVLFDEFAKSGDELVHLLFVRHLSSDRLVFDNHSALGFGHLSLHRPRHDCLGDPRVATNRASQLARICLLVIGSAVLEPALKLMAVRADEVVTDHNKTPRRDKSLYMKWLSKCVQAIPRFPKAQSGEVP